MTPDPAALTADSFSLIAIFLRASWVVKAIMVALAAASLWSWAIIIDKAFRLTALNREANAFEDKVSSGRSLEDVAAEVGEGAKHPLPRLLQAALREWREGRPRGPVILYTRQHAHACTGGFTSPKANSYAGIWPLGCMYHSRSMRMS